MTVWNSYNSAHILHSALKLIWAPNLANNHSFAKFASSNILRHTVQVTCNMGKTTAWNLHPHEMGSTLRDTLTLWLQRPFTNAPMLQLICYMHTYTYIQTERQTYIMGGPFHSMGLTRAHPNYLVGYYWCLSAYINMRMISGQHQNMCWCAC